MKRCLVTGAGGFLGTYMVDLLVERGFIVVATDLPSKWLPDCRNVRFVPSNLTDVESLRPLFKESLDYVFHFGAIVDIRANLRICRRVNVGGVRNVCELAREAGVRAVVQTSSGSVYGNAAHANEDSPKAPIEPYAQSKWEGELAALEYQDLPIAFLRPGFLYGQGMSRDLARAVFFMAEKGLMVIPTGNYKVPMVHVKDVAGAALFLAVQLDAGKPIKGEAYNIADRTPITIDRLFALIAKVMHIPVVRIPSKLVVMVAYLNEFFGHLPHVKPLVTVSEAKYFLNSHILDVSKLVDLGFQHEYPSSEDGFKEIIQLVTSSGDKTSLFKRKPLAYLNR